MSLSRAFFKKLTKISEEVGMNPRDLLLVMYSESGLKSDIVNQDKQYGGAVGLIQFMPDTLRGLGVPKSEIADFGKKSAEDQLDYVKRYIQGQMAFTKRPFKSASEYYHANFFPLTLTRWKGSDPIANGNTVIVAKDSKDRREQVAYKANRGLDTNNDGLITVSDMTAVLMRSANRNGFQQALAQLNAVAGEGQVTEVSKNPDLLKQKKAPTQVASNNSFSGIEAFLDQISQFFSSFSNTKALASTTNKDKMQKLANKSEVSKFLIVVGAEDFVTKTEYARILQSVLQEELKVNSTIHSSDDSLEISCSLPLSTDRAQDVLKEVCAAVSDVFEYATMQNGGYKTCTVIKPESISTHPPMDITASEVNRRKFKLKISLGSK